MICIKLLCISYVINSSLVLKTIHEITKKTILNNKHLISVEKCELFHGELNPIVVGQYTVDGLEGMPLSPRSFSSTGEKYECCSQCFSSLKPSIAKKTDKPPKCAIANGFAIGFILISIETKDAEGNNATVIIDEIDDMMAASLSVQRPYGFVFSYYGGAQKSLMGHYSFFEMNQSHAGGVINHFRKTGANDHIICVLCGRLTPNKKERARSKAAFDTEKFLYMLNWFISTAKHYAYKDVTPPHNYEEPQIVEEEENASNTDVSVNQLVENEFGGGTFTFAISQNPTENNGVFKDTTKFGVSVLNCANIMLYAYGGTYVTSGSELHLEQVFPLQFSVGIGGRGMMRQTKMSEISCLQHYLQLSLPQFMKGDLTLVVFHLYNQAMSYKSGLVTCRDISNGDGQSFAEQISTLTDIEINAAAKKKSENISNSSFAGNVLRRIVTSCKALVHSRAAAIYNRRLMFAICDCHGMPDVFFTLTPDDEHSFRV